MKKYLLLLLLGLSINVSGQTINFIGYTEQDIVSIMTTTEHSNMVFVKRTTKPNKDISIEYKNNINYATQDKAYLAFFIDDKSKKCNLIIIVELLSQLPYTLKELNDTTHFIKIGQFQYVDIEGLYKYTITTDEDSMTTTIESLKY